MCISKPSSSFSSASLPAKKIKYLRTVASKAPGTYKERTERERDRQAIKYKTRANLTRAESRFEQQLKNVLQNIAFGVSNPHTKSEITREKLILSEEAKK